MDARPWLGWVGAGEGTSGRGMMGEGTWGMYFAGEAAQYGYPFPGNLGLGHQQNDGQGRAVELGSGGGRSALADQGPGRGMDFVR